MDTLSTVSVARSGLRSVHAAVKTNGARMTRQVYRRSGMLSSCVLTCLAKGLRFAMSLTQETSCMSKTTFACRRCLPRSRDTSSMLRTVL